MKTRFSFLAVILLGIVMCLITIGGWMAKETSAQNGAPVSSMVLDTDFTGAFDWGKTAVSTSTLYLPTIFKAGEGLRDFALPIPLFASDSAWRQTATSAAVLPSSAQQILVTYRVLRGQTSHLIPGGTDPINWPYIVINYDDYSVSIYRAGTLQTSVYLCDYDGIPQWPHPKFNLDQLGGPVTVPAPVGEIRPSGPQNTDADGHLVIYDSSTFTAYDYYAATTQRDAQCQSWGGGFTGSQIFEAGALDFFDVRGPGVNADTLSSARAHGTPLLAGMILPEDIASGTIAHALGFAIPGPRNLASDPYEPLTSDYFYPTSTTEGDFYNINANSLAAGQRIRLKSTIVDDEGNWVDENQLSPVSQMVLTALRDYGAYLVDNAGGFVFYAEDVHSANLNLSDDALNALIGQPSNTPLPANKTKWQIVMETLDNELSLIPIAYGPWTDGQNPATATISTANFEVVAPATQP